ncbi:HET-domain-containing protein [Hyaloscypha variabilis F]|uniref:HET-domain-containing protein n=1 Tax=Hyaloscypha variabilis (strain UAMH 11265 / GT02V1 / F) TaxID=1149755 RepID=A0A2J6RJ83_HYAVF|nr:HET-domain-containing protein [Hyaloscypha variabilis F]
MKPYTYTALAPQHIRQLTLYPGQLDALIEVSINQVLFTEDECPPYEALSYCWGSEDNPQTIIIRPNGSLLEPAQDVVSLGQQDYSDVAHSPSNLRTGASGAQSPCTTRDNPSSTFSVSSNLHSALLRLRLRSEARVLWIDAICINQADNDEKSIQIRKMGSIYSNAQRVVVWLGPESDHTRRAIDALDHLGRQVVWDPESGRISQARDCDPDCKEWYHRNHTLLYDVDTWSGIADLVNRPWYTRVWIWQEILLANQSTSILLCGPAEISWATFKNSIMCLSLKQEYGSQPELSDTVWENCLEMLVRLVSVSHRRQTILGLLNAMQNYSSCYNHRDRLYAILDLGIDGKEVNIEPDYNKTVAQVYYDYCVEHVRRCGSSAWGLSFLSSCEIDNWQEGPTWVPNWRKPISSYPSDLSPHAGSWKGSCELIDGLKLRVNAVRCGVVQSCSSTAPTNLSMATLLPLLQNWLFGISDNIMKRILAVLMDDQFASRMGPGSPTFEECWEFLNICLKATPTSPLNLLSLPPFPHIFSLLKSFVSGRCLFRTTNDQWGLGPPSMQHGDLVYSVIGCHCLILLRQNEDQKFIVVGMCSLEEHTDMEALLGPLPLGYHVEEDSIRRWSYDMWFVNPDAAIKTRVDPRLGSRHTGWSTERDEDDCIIWQNIESGEETWFDPRHSDISFLRSRGVKIESIDIV